MERTLSIIKPDGVTRGLTGKVIARFEEEGIKVVAMRMLHLTRKQAEGFYAVHRARPFFDSLCSYMCSGPIVVMVLQGDNIIFRNRTIMGATNPAQADEGTIRKLFAQNIERNTVHGSDARETAALEIAYFFKELDLVDYERV